MATCARCDERDTCKINKSNKNVIGCNKSNTKGIYLKLNRKTDADILRLLDEVKNKQGYIKALIRKDLKAELGCELYRYFEEG